MKPQYEGSPNQRWGHISYAQHGDDFMLINLFEMLGIDKPSYLDLGAHDPVEISNTKLLYDRGSRGVNVEANPVLASRFRYARPFDVTVCCGVGLIDGEAAFYKHSDLSGLNTFSRAEAATIVGEAGVEKLASEVLPILTINTILYRHCKSEWPDLLSCDIEGLDFDVLKSAEFGAYDNIPKVICVETRKHQGAEMRQMLLAKGYICYCRMGENLFFVRSDLHHMVF